MSEDTRSRVLDAAGPVFAKKGFERATVREICKAAGVNLASVNYHFGDKEQLYVETVRRAREILANQFPLPNHGPEAPATRRLRGFIGTLLHRMIGGEENPWQTRLMIREVLQPTRVCQQLVEEYFRPHFELLLDIVQDMLPDDVPRHVIQQIGFSIVGQCFYYRIAGRVVSMLVSPEDSRRYFTIDALADHITRMTSAALGCAESFAMPLETAESAVD